MKLKHFAHCLLMICLMGLPISWAVATDLSAIDELGNAGHDALIMQTGDYNAATLQQTGHHQQLSLSQTGTYNQADIYQTGGYQQVSVTQIGKENTVFSKQFGRHHEAVINQHGHGNHVKAEQSALMEWSASLKNGIVMCQNGKPFNYM